MLVMAFYPYIHWDKAEINSKNGIKIAINDDADSKNNVSQHTEASQFLREYAG